jgi:hypothetical protein
MVSRLYGEIGMKRIGTILFAISLSAAALPGQNAVQQGAAAIAGMEPVGTNQQTGHLIIIQGLPPEYACPVTLHAGHLADGSFVKTDAAHPKGIGQWLSLSLASPEARQIARATLVVRGLTPQGHVTRALSANGASAHAVRTFHVSFSQGPNQTSLANLWVPGMSAVERIDLLEVNYSDGSTWKVTDDQSCRVEPDLKMLITSR